MNKAVAFWIFMALVNWSLMTANLVEVDLLFTSISLIGVALSVWLIYYYGKPKNRTCRAQILYSDKECTKPAAVLITYEDNPEGVRVEVCESNIGDGSSRRIILTDFDEREVLSDLGWLRDEVGVDVAPPTVAESLHDVNSEARFGPAHQAHSNKGRRDPLFEEAVRIYEQGGSPEDVMRELGISQTKAYEIRRSLRRSKGAA